MHDIMDVVVDAKVWGGGQKLHHTSCSLLRYTLAMTGDKKILISI